MTRLRRSDLTRPGITRTWNGSNWHYRQPTGEPLDQATRQRCEALVIPPAWQDVWICPHHNGHVQAVGTDAAGRRQYRYHEQWTADRAQQNFERVLNAARVLPEVRRASQQALAQDGLTKARVLGCAVRLLELGFFRIGSETYAEENGSFGLATVRRDHVTLEETRVIFDYRAKSGKQRHSAVADPAIRACVEELLARDDPDEELLAWWDEDRERWVNVHSDDINNHLRAVSGIDLTAKDFRTWSATVLCAIALAVSTSVGDSPTARKRAVVRAVTETAHYLGNTPAVCRRSYIHPRLLDLYDDGITVADELAELGAEAGEGDFAYQGRVEAAVLAMLTDPQVARRRAARRRKNTAALPAPSRKAA
jgi:DNA topoisomerase IB